jgi:fatty acid desaturase
LPLTSPISHSKPVKNTSSVIGTTKATTRRASGTSRAAVLPLFYVALFYVALFYVALFYVALFYVALFYVALFYVAHTARSSPSRISPA